MGKYPHVRDQEGLLWMGNSPIRALLLLCVMLLLGGQAAALPRYARQTGYPCVKCHVGGFGPQLTPYGVRFKLSAYTETDRKGLKIPVAMFAFGGVPTPA